MKEIIELWIVSGSVATFWQLQPEPGGGDGADWEHLQHGGDYPLLRPARGGPQCGGHHDEPHQDALHGRGRLHRLHQVQYSQYYVIPWLPYCQPLHFRWVYNKHKKDLQLADQDLLNAFFGTSPWYVALFILGVVRKEWYWHFIRKPAYTLNLKWPPMQ